jgi:hypothetical protein
MLQHTSNDRNIEDGVAYIELGHVRDAFGNNIKVRWDRDTHIVQVRLVSILEDDSLLEMDECGHCTHKRNSFYGSVELGTRKGTTALIWIRHDKPN